MFSGVYWNQPVCPSMCPTVQNILVSVKALGRVNAHLVIALVKQFEKNFVKYAFLYA